MGSWGDERCLSCVLTRKGEVRMAQGGFKPPNPASSRAAFKKKCLRKRVLGEIKRVVERSPDCLGLFY